MPIPIGEFGRLTAAKRGSRGVRAVAAEIGISPATLSRVENGHMPDLATFANICKWLNRDPREFLGIESDPAETPAQKAVVHFKKKPTVTLETANALGELILAAQAAIRARNDLVGR